MRILYAAALSLMPAALAAQGAELIEVSYHCERGVEIPVVYINTPDQPGQLVAMIEGRLVAMTQVISASGARYRSAGEEAYQLWNKGDTAWLAWGPEEASEPVLEDCVADEA